MAERDAIANKTGDDILNDEKRQRCPERVAKELLEIVTQKSSIPPSKVLNTRSEDQVDGSVSTNDDHERQNEQMDNEEYIRIMKK